METSLRFGGLREVERELRGMSSRIARRELRLGMRKGAEPVRRMAAALAPVRPMGFSARFGGLGRSSTALKQKQPPGTLKRSIRIFDGKRKHGQVTVLVGPTGAAWYAHFVEFGTKAHAARMTKGKKRESFEFDPDTLEMKSKTTTVRESRQKRAHHATRARPFLRPAIDAYGGRLLQTTAEHLDDFISRRRRR